MSNFFNPGQGVGQSALMLPQRILIGLDPAQWPATTTSSAAFSGANTAYLIPFWLPRSAKLKGIAYHIGGNAGTVDVGVYYDLSNLGTTAARIFSSGALADAAGINLVSVPGMTLAGGNQRYFVVITGSTITTLSVHGWPINPAARLSLSGMFQVAGAGPTLAASLTLATVGNPIHVPMVALDLAPA